MKQSFITAILLINFTPFAAQEKENNIDEVVVHGKFLNTPYSKVNENVKVISNLEIKNSPAKNIDDILQQVVGLDIRRRGANGVQSDVAMRGGSFEQVLILINGIRMNDSQTGHNSLNIPVDLSNIERIEIIKGPAARRFGQNAYAGVINIITKPSAEETVKISAEGGDFETYNLGLTATFGNEKMTNLFQATSGGSGGYRHNTDSEIRNVFYQNQLKLNNGSIGLQAGFQEKKFGANGFYASSKATEQYEEMQASIVAINHNATFGKFSLNSNIYWRRGQDMYLYNRQKPAIYRNMHLGNNIGGEINSTYKSSLGTTGLGIELRKELLVSNNLGNRNRFVTQAFLEHHFSLLNDRLSIVPGISWANYSTNGNFFYPGLDVGFDITEHHKIYGNIAKVHRVPTFTDLYYKSKTEWGNPALNPENAVYSEVGYRFQNRTILAKLSGFMRNSKNSIDWIRATENDPWTTQNVGAIDVKGIETELEHQATDWLKYSIGYTYLDSSHKKKGNLDSKDVLNNMKNQLVSKLQIKFLKYFTNELVYRYQERGLGKSYNLVDEQLNFRKDNFEIYTSISNLTNTKYSEAFGVPMPGRWFNIGVNYKFVL